REGQGLNLLYSITWRLRFNRVEPIYRMVRRVIADQIFILIENKCDERTEHEVHKEDGAARVQRLGSEFTETSAKTAQNVEGAVTSVVRELRQARDANQILRKKKCIIL
ncbi:hypothetical protein B0H19DRAFT_963453, partial [Mycena capillaripes]